MDRSSEPILEPKDQTEENAKSMANMETPQVSPKDFKISQLEARVHELELQNSFLQNQLIKATSQTTSPLSTMCPSENLEDVERSVRRSSFSLSANSGYSHYPSRLAAPHLSPNSIKPETDEEIAAVLRVRERRQSYSSSMSNSKRTERYTEDPDLSFWEEDREYSAKTSKSGKHRSHSRSSRARSHARRRRRSSHGEHGEEKRIESETRKDVSGDASDSISRKRSSRSRKEGARSEISVSKRKEHNLGKTSEAYSINLGTPSNTDGDGADQSPSKKRDTNSEAKLLRKKLKGKKSSKICKVDACDERRERGAKYCRAHANPRTSAILNPNQRNSLFFGPKS